MTSFVRVAPTHGLTTNDSYIFPYNPSFFANTLCNNKHKSKNKVHPSMVHITYRGLKTLIYAITSTTKVMKSHAIAIVITIMHFYYLKQQNITQGKLQNVAFFTHT